MKWEYVLISFTIIVIWYYKDKEKLEPIFKIEYSDLPDDLELAISELSRKSKYFKNVPNFPKTLPPVPTTKGNYGSIGERYSIEFLESLYNKIFIKIRPNWLKNPKTGRNLELDGYCEELKLAIEYNGPHHYPSTAGITENEQKQIDRDLIKKKLCDIKGIKLLVIPYTIPIKRVPLAIYCQILEKDG